MGPEEEINLNEILARAGVITAKDVADRTLKQIRKLWLSKTSRLGFTPTPEEGNKLAEIAKNPTYQSFVSCVGKFEYNRFVKLGILLYELKVRGEDQRIREIRREVYNSKYSKFATQIINIGATGVLLHVLNYLTDRRTQHPLTKYAMQKEFERILELWQKASLSISGQDSEQKIRHEIMSRLDQRLPIICIYASKHHHASSEKKNKKYDPTDHVLKTQRIIADLKVKGIFKGNYLLWSKTLVYVNIEQYVCILHSVEEELNTVFG